MIWFVFLVQASGPQTSCTPSSGGQLLHNSLRVSGLLSTTNVIDQLTYTGINVQSDKTLVGKGIAVLNGKRLRFVGVSSNIIQNIAIIYLNPVYVAVKVVMPIKLQV